MEIDSLSFWGILLAFIVVSMLIRVIFNIYFSFPKVLAGLIIILLGIRIIFGGGPLWPFKTSDNVIFFTSDTICVKNEFEDKYQLAFSNAVFNLDSGSSNFTEKSRLRINSVFSACTVYLPEELPAIVKVEGIFAGVKLPQRNLPLFGSGNYSTAGIDPEKPHLDITVNVVFGSVTMMHIKPEIGD
jgi:hypothetical protein